MDNFNFCQNIIYVLPREYRYCTGSGWFYQCMLYNLCKVPFISMASIENLISFELIVITCVLYYGTLNIFNIFA